MTKDGIHRLPRALATGLAGAALLLLVACGGGSDGNSGGSDAEQIENLVEGFIDQTFSNDPKKAYDKLSSSAKANCTEKEFVEQAQMARALFTALGGGGKFEVERVYDVRVTGDKATAKIEVTLGGEPSSEEADDATFTRENGVWKIDEGC